MSVLLCSDLLNQDDFLRHICLLLKFVLAFFLKLENVGTGGGGGLATRI